VHWFEAVGMGMAVDRALPAYYLTGQRGVVSWRKAAGDPRTYY